MTAQLRMYRIKGGQLEEFVREWKAAVVPLREKLGFKVEGAWTIRGEDRFVWIVSYDGADGFEARDAAYYASPERKNLRPNPAPRVEHADHWLMERVPL